MSALQGTSRGILGNNFRRKCVIVKKRCCSSGRQPVRVRFAPSPTGLLHLGGFRTALVNYLFAMKHNGKFILRVEDTDQARLVPDAMRMLEEDLNWLELSPHESPEHPGNYGPYIQSQRLQIYEENLRGLIDSGHAYECFCSEMRLDILRREALKQRQRPRYDNKCRDLTRDQIKAKKAAGQKFTVRFKLQPEQVRFHDLVYGPVEMDCTENNYEGDPIIIKSDGFPTYHFANVVDDHLMDISHVLRGVEWQVSTPKHLQLYRAFKWNPPEFAHLPLVVNKDGSKLSKRQGDISIRHYRSQFLFPKALTNFVTKSGGGFADHNVDTIFSSVDLAAMFELSKVNTAACKLDFALLSKLNQIELKNQVSRDLSEVVSSLQNAIAGSSLPNKDAFLSSSEYLKKVVEWCPERISTISDLLTPEFSYLWTTPSSDTLLKISCSSSTIKKFAGDLKVYLDSVGSIESVNPRDLSQFIQDYAVKERVKFKDLMKDLRLALCGVEKGPPIIDILILFHKDTFIRRILEAASRIAENVSNNAKTNVKL